MGKDKILITGGAGFIGSKLALYLARKYKVTILDNLSKQIHGENAPIDSWTYKQVLNQKNIKIVIGDVKDLDTWRNLILQNDIIYHLAAETGTGQSMYQISNYSKVNIHGTALLFQALSENQNHSVRKIIYASSRSIYGEGKYLDSKEMVHYPRHRSIDKLRVGDFNIYNNHNEPLTAVATDEDSKIHPSSFYGLTKQFQEDMIHSMSPHFGITPISLRLQNVYGEGQSLNNPYTGIMSIFSNLLRTNKEIKVFEDGNETRDFIHVDDVVRAFDLARKTDIKEGRIYNVGTGIPTKIIDVANSLKKLLKSNSSIVINGAFRKGDIRHNYADITKIQQELNFHPSISFSEGLMRFTVWVKKISPKESKYLDSLKEMKSKGLYEEA